MMKASQFSDAQKAFVLKQGDEGVPVAEICRKAGISSLRWSRNLGRFKTAEALIAAG